MMRKRILILILVLLILIMLSGCYWKGTTLYFNEPIPELSFTSYQVTEETLTEEIDTDGDGKPDDTQTTGYKYTFAGELINEGKPGHYVISISGKQVNSEVWENLMDYGPVYIEEGKATFSLEYIAGPDNRFEQFKMQLYAIDKDGNRKLQAEVEY